MERRNSADCVVTWHAAEDALVAAFEYLAALPDRERGFLSAGSRSCWPRFGIDPRDLRELQAGYADDTARPSPALTRRRVALVEAMLTGERAASLAVPEEHRRLVGRVVRLIMFGGRHAPEGFSWSAVWEMEGGRACGVTSDALRRRYERAIEKLARRMTAMGMGALAAA